MSSAYDALGGAIAALGEVRLLAAIEAGGRDARTAQRLLDEAQVRRTRLAVGRVVGLVTAVALAMHLTWERAPWVTAVVVGAVAFVQAAISAGFGAAARARAVSWALPLARLLRPVDLLVAPFAFPVHLLASSVGRWLEEAHAPADDEHSLREVEHMIEKREESGSITEEFAELLLSVFEFKDTVAREVMVPRTLMKAFEIDTPLDEVIEHIERHGHSRYPVFRDTVDRIEGILYAKDLFRILRERDGRTVTLPEVIRRPVFFVAETQKIGQLLREMQANRFHLAVVVDEFGGTSGLVTLEDILEEIVGEIQDEHDAVETPIRELGEGHLLVDARVSVYDVAHVLDADFETEDGDYDSVGGMVVERAGRVPAVGESITFRGFEFIVRAADERHVTEVEILARPDADGPEHAAAE
ncbi:MAG: HlyC/CorC family transporter [Sandaracinaceae bacterium]|nr:HlyC/CorC family transporter [Sandaracinaceae bacterium]